MGYAVCTLQYYSVQSYNLPILANQHSHCLKHPGIMVCLMSYNFLAFTIYSWKVSNIWYHLFLSFRNSKVWNIRDIKEWSQSLWEARAEQLFPRSWVWTGENRGCYGQHNWDCSLERSQARCKASCKWIYTINVFFLFLASMLCLISAGHYKTSTGLRRSCAALASFSGTFDLILFQAINFEFIVEKVWFGLV